MIMDEIIKAVINALKIYCGSIYPPVGNSSQQAFSLSIFDTQVDESPNGLTGLLENGYIVVSPGSGGDLERAQHNSDLSTPTLETYPVEIDLWGFIRGNPSYWRKLCDNINYPTTGEPGITQMLEEVTLTIPGAIFIFCRRVGVPSYENLDQIYHSKLKFNVQIQINR